MNLSHAYSGHAAKPKSYLGLGLVVVLHVAGIYALSAGLIRVPTTHKEPIHLLPPVNEKQPERQVEPTYKPDKPVVAPIHVPEVPELPWHVEQQKPTVTTSTARDDTPTVPTGPGTIGNKPTTSIQVTEQSAIRTPGAVCSVMPQPEIPAVNWTGEAVLQVLATVRGGRVVGSDVRVMQGALDGKTKRSLQRSVESALAGYQCQGDATFQQDFAFRID